MAWMTERNMPLEMIYDAILGYIVSCEETVLLKRARSEQIVMRMN